MKEDEVSIYDVRNALEKMPELKRNHTHCEMKGGDESDCETTRWHTGIANRKRHKTEACFRANFVERLRKNEEEEPLNTLHYQKLVDATNLLQKNGSHSLAPLESYTPRELYLLMASVTEVWKNCGKAAWKKRINKIKTNVRTRKPPRNVLNESDREEIRRLEAKILQRELWEAEQKEKLVKEKKKPR